MRFRPVPCWLPAAALAACLLAASVRSEELAVDPEQEAWKTAESLERTERYAAAAEAFLSLANGAHDGAQALRARFAAGRCWVRGGDYAQARETIAALRRDKAGVDSADRLEWMLGESCLARHPDGPRAGLREALAIAGELRQGRDPKTSAVARQAAVLAGRAHVRLGEYDRARECFDAAIQAAPDSDEARLAAVWKDVAGNVESDAAAEPPPPRRREEGIHVFDRERRHVLRERPAASEESMPEPVVPASAKPAVPETKPAPKAAVETPAPMAQNVRKPEPAKAEPEPEPDPVARVEGRSAEPVPPAPAPSAQEPPKPSEEKPAPAREPAERPKRHGAAPAVEEPKPAPAAGAVEDEARAAQQYEVIRHYYYRLKQTNAAALECRKLIERYPQSAYSAKARAILDEIERRAPPADSSRKDGE